MVLLSVLVKCCLHDEHISSWLMYGAIIILLFIHFKDFTEEKKNWLVVCADYYSFHHSHLFTII